MFLWLLRCCGLFDVCLRFISFGLWVNDYGFIVLVCGVQCFDRFSRMCVLRLFGGRLVGLLYCLIFLWFCVLRGIRFF